MDNNRDARRVLKWIHRYLIMVGIDPLASIRFLIGIPRYLLDLGEFQRQRRRSTVEFPSRGYYPYLGDRHAQSGTAGGHYFHQDLFVARRIFLHRPTRHVDIGSRVDGFVAHVASFREIEVFDIRPATSKIHNITFVRADMMGELRESLIDYTDSVSCLHALEHFGLGRYGDPVNFEGYLNGLSNIYRVLQRDGKLYLSVPIGPQHVEFNGQRVFSVQYVVGLLSDKYSVDMFSYVDDEGNFHEDAALDDSDMLRANFGCHYGCGIFELTKR